MNVNLLKDISYNEAKKELDTILDPLKKVARGLRCKITLDSAGLVESDRLKQKICEYLQTFEGKAEKEELIQILGDLQFLVSSINDLGDGLREVAYYSLLSIKSMTESEISEITHLSQATVNRKKKLITIKVLEDMNYRKWIDEADTSQVFEDS